MEGVSTRSRTRRNDTPILENNSNSIPQQTRRRIPRIRKLTKKQVCEEGRRITYDERKRRIQCDIKTAPWNLNMYNDILKYKGSGKEFDGSNELFKISNRQFGRNDYYGGIPLSTTYIYIISKTVGKDTYFKVGEGGKGNEDNDEGTKHTSGRLGSANTFLIPGLKDIGFKVHFVFFFHKIGHPYTDVFIGQYMEKQIHSTLRKQFPQSNISFMNQKESEWYLVQDKEELFFIGFIFDIIASYESFSMMNPLAIWKYTSELQTLDDLKSNKYQIELPKENEVKDRLGNSELWKEAQHQVAILRNNTRPLNIAVIDKQPDDTKKNIQEIIKYFESKNKQFSIDYNNIIYNFTITNISKPKNPQDGRKAYLYYVEFTSDQEDQIVMKILNENKVFVYAEQNEEDINKTIYYIFISDFLALLESQLTIEQYENWSLKTIYLKFTSKNVPNVNIIENKPVAIPSFYYDKTFQDFYGPIFVKDEPYEDYSVNDLTNKTVKKWQNLGYEGQHIIRQEVSTIDNKLIDNTEERKSIIDIMIMKGIIKKKGENNSIGKNNKKGNEVTVDSFKIDNVEYEKGDIVEANDSLFIYFNDEGCTIPDENHRNKWTRYKIQKIYNDKNSNEIVNPYMDIREVDASNKKYKSNEIWVLSMRFLTKDNFKMVQEKPRTYKGKYKEGDYVELYPRNYPLNNKDLFRSEWTKYNHYVIIRMKNDDFYGIQFMKPFDKMKLWNVWGNEHVMNNNDDKIINVHVREFDKSTKKLPMNDDSTAKLNTYTDELPYLVYQVNSISGHNPINVKTHADLIRDRAPNYTIEWEENGKNVEKKQDAKIIDKIITNKTKKSYVKNLKEKIEEYWKNKENQPQKPTKTRKKRKDKSAVNNENNDVSSKYKLNSTSSLEDKLKFATKIYQSIDKNFSKIKDIFNVIIQRDEKGFRIGDIFYILLSKNNACYGYLCYYYQNNSTNDPDSRYTYGVLFSDCNKNKLEEYSEEELAQFLNSDESATIDALTTYNEPGGDYAGFYTDTIKRYEKLVEKHNS
jgi:hypothetical protein